jgi:hypothetical protein
MRGKLSRPKITEAMVLKSCLALLSYHPRIGLYWRANTGAMTLRSGNRQRFVRFGVAGQPDIFAVLKPFGQLIGIECKRPGNKPTAAQDAFGDALEASGGVYVVAISAEALKRAIDDLSLPAKPCKSGTL